MGIIGIDHVQLAMPAGQESAAAAFYVDLLGFTQVTKPPALAARGGCWFETPDGQGASGRRVRLPPGPQGPSGAAGRRPGGPGRPSAAAGIEVREENGLDGHLQRYVDDPFGNRIELLQRLS